MADPITKNSGVQGQGGINTYELAAKIKTIEDIVEKGCKYGFLVVVLGRTKYDKVIGNPAVQWTTPEDPGGYDESIQWKDLSFDQCKWEKKHTRKVKYEKFLGVEEKFRTLMLQVVDESYLEALKEEYIQDGGRTPFEMI